MMIGFSVGTDRPAAQGTSGSSTAAPTPTPSDTTPNAFGFTDVTGARRSSAIESDAITVQGIDAPAPVSVTGGEYRIDAGAWTASPGSILVGQSVRLRLTSSASYATIASATLTIGGVSDGWIVTTEAEPAPAPTPTPVPTPTPTPTLTARQVAFLYAPGHAGEGLNTGDGTAKTYTTPTLTNLSGKPMTTASIVNAGWITAADGQGQELAVGNACPLAGTIRNAAGAVVGTFTWGGAASTAIASNASVASDAVALSTPIPAWGEFTVTLTGTVPSGASYPPKFGLVGVRTHTTTDGLNPVSILLTGDSLMALNGGAEVPLVGTEGLVPCVAMAVTGNTLSGAAGANFARRADLLTKLGATVLLNELCINSRSSANLVAWAGDIADQARAAGVSPWQSTMTPVIGNTNYAVPGQTVTADESNRINFNTAVRGLLGGKIDRAVEFADATEYARNDGRFRYAAASGRYLKSPQMLFDPTIEVAVRPTRYGESISATTFPLDFGFTLALRSGNRTVTAVTGANAGATRTMSANVGSGVYTTTTAWDVVPAIGDTFRVELEPSNVVNGTVDKIHMTNRNQAAYRGGTHFLLAAALRYTALDAMAAAGYRAAPTVRTFSSDPNADLPFGGTGDVVVPYGMGRGGDAGKPYNSTIDEDTLLLLVVATANEVVATPAGWTALPAIGSGTAGGTASARLSLFWRRHAIGTNSVTLTDPGDHAVATVLAIPNAAQTGDPFNAVATAVQAGGAAATGWPAVTTTVDNALVLAMMADSASGDGGRLSAQAAPTLARLASHLNSGTGAGNGSGLAVFGGTQRTAGAVAAPGATHGSAGAVRALMTVAIRGR